MKPRSQWKQPKRSPLKPRTTPIARESEKAKARRLSTISGKEKTGPKASNPARKKKNLQRAHGSPERRAWMKAQPCYICGRTPSDAAHMRSGGVSRKSGVEWTAPLCSDDVRSGYVGHHSEFDAGKQSFALKYDFDRDEAAAQTHRRWLAHSAPAVSRPSLDQQLASWAIVEGRGGERG